MLNNDPNNLDFKFDLIFRYAGWGMKEEAKKIVYTLPSEAYYTQDLTMKYVLEGEEWIQDTRIRIIRFTIMLCDFIRAYVNKVYCEPLQKIEGIKAVMQIESIALPISGNEIDLIQRAYQNISIAGLYCEAGDSENALAHAEKAARDAMCHIEYMYKPDENGNNYYPESTPRNLPWRLWEDHLTKPQFDIIRNDGRFIKCFELLKANSRELKS